MFFFTNVAGLCQELKTKTVSHGAALAYQILTGLALLPWPIIAYYLKLLFSAGTLQPLTLNAALLGTAGHYCAILIAVLQFRYYSQKVAIQGRWLAFASITWVTHVRYFVRTLAFGLVIALALILALKFQLVSKAQLGGLLFGFAFSPDLQMLAHFVLPLIFGLTYQLLLNESLRELVRA